MIMYAMNLTQLLLFSSFSPAELLVGAALSLSELVQCISSIARVLLLACGSLKSIDPIRVAACKIAVV